MKFTRNHKQRLALGLALLTALTALTGCRREEAAPIAAVTEVTEIQESLPPETFAPAGAVQRGDDTTLLERVFLVVAAGDVVNWDYLCDILGYGGYTVDRGAEKITLEDSERPGNTMWAYPSRQEGYTLIRELGFGRTVEGELKAVTVEIWNGGHSISMRDGWGLSLEEARTYLDMPAPEEGTFLLERVFLPLLKTPSRYETEAEALIWSSHCVACWGEGMLSVLDHEHPGFSLYTMFTTTDRGYVLGEVAYSTYRDNDAWGAKCVFDGREATYWIGPVGWGEAQQVQTVEEMIDYLQTLFREDGVEGQETAFRDVLLGKAQLTYVSGDTREETSIFKVPELFAPGDGSMKIWNFAVTDLDGDGVAEAVLFLCGAAGDSEGHLILHRMGGKIYGYAINHRSLTDLKTDGSFEYFDPTGMVEGGICRVAGFTEEGMLLDKFTYGSGTPELWDIFVVDGQPTTGDAYWSAMSEQSAKPGAEWFDFTEENIEGAFSK